jgi:hypothetical protein
VGIVYQILSLPHIYIWLPILVFVAIAGVGFWLSRPGGAVAAEPLSQPVQALTAAPGKQPDQRGAHRRAGNTIEVHVATPTDKEDPSLANVLDRSTGGVRLALFSEVAVGTVLSIRPVRADDMVPWVDVEIRSCQPSKEVPGAFEVGCQYVKSPPYSIQLLFG